MATSIDYIKYVCDQVHGVGEIRYKKMFGEYMVYVNDKPILLVCDNTVYVKEVEAIHSLMEHAQTGHPYDGAKEHYILDIDDADFARSVITVLETVTVIPHQKSKKQK